MSIALKVAKGATWLAFFKLLSQIFSWIITILVARILIPGDYGLMEMSTIITGYAMMFSELGLGSAIIQRQNITENEMSSIFWFMLGISTLMASLCFVVAYPTAFIFHENRVIPLTQAVSVLFIITGLQIVPLNLMRKDLEFKKIGLIEMTGAGISSLAMYMLAYMGAGVWTLLGGHIIREFIKLVLLYINKRWLPKAYMNFSEVRSYLGFGINVAAGRSFFYVYDKADRFFAGRAWSTQLLGYYSFALQLAKIPTEKIVSLINMVSFPAFSQFQGSPERFNSFYLNIIKVTMVIVLPIFVGGFMVGEDIVRILLDSKWLPIIPLFKYLCLAQIFVSLTALNNMVHIAQGRPMWSLYFNLICTIFMPISFYFATRHNLNSILIPWFTTYLAISCAWVMITLSKIGIRFLTYVKYLLKPVFAVIVMSFAILLFENLMSCTYQVNVNIVLSLAVKIVIGAFFYIGYLYVFDKEIFLRLKNIRSLEHRE